MKVAVLDLGTNTFHLMIAQVNKDRTWKKELHRKITVKLGQGGIHRNWIAPGPYSRGINAIGEFRKSIDASGVNKIFAFGTAALRTADNGRDFLKQIARDYQIRVQLINGDEEAFLIYSGVRKAVRMGEDVSLIMDIGGGSTEFILATGSKVLWKQSFKLGAALLREKFRISDPVSGTELRTLNGHFQSILKPLLSACTKYKPVRLIGSAGSFETVASMIRFRNPAAGSHYGKSSHRIAVADLNTLHKDLIRSTTAKRKEMRGLISMRVDMIVPASILLNFVLKNVPVKEIILSSYSLKEGVIEKMIHGKSL